MLAMIQSKRDRSLTVIVLCSIQDVAVLLEGRRDNEPIE